MMDLAYFAEGKHGHNTLRGLLLQSKDPAYGLGQMTSHSVVKIAAI